MKTLCRTLVVSALVFVLPLGAPAQTFEHPQQRLFGAQQAVIQAGENPNAELLMVNPNFWGEDMGVFKMPSAAEFLNSSGEASKRLLKLFSVSTDYRATENHPQEFFVPPETGRGLQLQPSSHPLYRDILIKGTGTVAQFTVDNQLRFSHLGFDGYFEVSEAIRDMHTAEILHQAGASVVRGLAIVDHGALVKRNNIAEPLRMGNYVRAFKVQTRLSNLQALLPEERKAAIDDAILQLQKIFKNTKPMTYVEYFLFIAKRLAKTAAVYQTLGYTQDSLHFGQLTLAGEMADLGVGSFEKPKHAGEMNTKYPWFRFERQPTLMQNMLYRTHSVKAEPEPALLPPDSTTVNAQKTLFGYIASFDPQAAREIERLDPAQVFWNAYEEYYQAIPAPRFREWLLKPFHRFYDWDFLPVAAVVSDSVTRAKLIAQYRAELVRRKSGLDRVGRWGIPDLPALAKMRIFGEVAQSMGVYTQELETELNKRIDQIGPWNVVENANQFIEPGNANLEPDLSWKPANASAFHEAKFGTHPLQSEVKSVRTGAKIGSKIVLPLEGTLSPFAVIVGETADTFLVSFENPKNGEIEKRRPFSKELIHGLNPEGGSRFSKGTEVAKIRIDANSELNDRASRLIRYFEGLESSTPLIDRQRAFLKRFLIESYIPFYTKLSESDQKAYINSMNTRVAGTTPVSLKSALWKGCGNCMDQTVFIASILEKVTAKVGIDYTVYVGKVLPGVKHWFIVLTLKPSMQQFIFDPTATAPRLMRFSEGNYHHWGGYGFITEAAQVRPPRASENCEIQLLPPVFEPLSGSPLLDGL